MNRYNLDSDYFKRKLLLIIAGLGNYKPDELSREFIRLAAVADVEAAKLKWRDFDEHTN